MCVYICVLGVVCLVCVFVACVCVVYVVCVCVELTDIMNQMDLTDIYGTFHPNIKEYTFFSTPHGTFYKIRHILSHKASLTRYKKTEITPCILPDHHGLKLDFNNNRKKVCTLMENEQLYTQWVKEEIKKLKTS